MEQWTILRDILVLLSAALLCGGLVSRLGHSPLMGYMIAGMFLGGPGSLGLVRSPTQIEAIAELGVALLLFSLGLEFSVSRLKRLGTRALVGGFFQVTFTLISAALVAMMVGLDFRSSLAFGAMVSLSSTAVVLRMLMESSELDMPHGRNCLAVLLTQDIAVVPLALLMSIIGGNGGLKDAVVQAGTLALWSAGLVGGLILLNKIAVSALGTLTLQRNRELTIVFAVVTGLGSAYASHAVGISPALGAFVAGMLLGSSSFATQIRADISSLRVILLTLFFSAAGMVANPYWILENWLLVAACLLAITIGKQLIIWVIFRWLGHSHRVSAATGICLAQIGEFAFVLGSIGKSNGVVSSELYSLVISIAIVSFLLCAVLVPNATKFADLLVRLFSNESPISGMNEATDEHPDVVIIGFGPAGQSLAQVLANRNLRVDVIDLNQEGTKRASELGFVAHIGDATQLDVLEHIKISLASSVIITVPHFQTASAIIDNVKQLSPHAFILARSRYKMHTDEILAQGVAVVGDEEEVGNELANQLGQWLNQSMPVNHSPGPEHEAK